MSKNGKPQAPLVADRRYRGGKAPAAKPKPRGTARKRTKAAPKRGPIGRVLGFFGRIIRRILGLIWGVFWRAGVAVSIIVAGAVLYYTTTLPPIEELVDGRARGSVTMLDQYGEVFATRGDQYGGMITFDSASPHLSNAIIATEDRRFYWHPGVDPIGVINAIRSNLTSSGGAPRGGSTLTQQTAKLLCNGRPFDPAEWESEAAYEADCRQGTVWRKAQEAVYAMAMELVYTKEEILTIYMNRAYMGGSSYGAEAAASRFFGISSSDLTPQQSAILAGLLQAPSRLSPTSNYERSWNRALTVLRLMNDQGYLSDDEYTVARNNAPDLTPGANTALPGGYFADWVMRTGPEFFTRDTTEDVVIETTLDPRIQLAAEQAVLSVYADTLSEGSEVQAAVVVMSADGAVRAMVGGRDVRATDVFNRAISAVRQPGSSFKPFVYAAALDLGYSPNDMINDAPTCWTTPGSGEWCPENYSGDYIGLMSLTDALRTSRNIPAIILSETVGRDAVRAVARGFGIDSELADSPALALGASEVTLIQLTGTYAGILNGGSAVAPYGLRSLTIRGDDTPLMEQGGGIGERVIQEGAARQLTWMMHQVVQSGTGARAQIEGHQLAGKTGTTNANRDAWFVGFSGDYVVGVWMGYDDNSPMRNVTGSSVPAEIWRRTMEGVLAGLPAVPLPMAPPDGGVGDTLAISDSLRITDAELDALLEQQFGAIPQGQATPQGTTNTAIDDALESIFGAPQN